MSVLITTYLYRCLIGLLVSLAADLHHHHNSPSPLKSSPSLPRNIPPPPRNLPLTPQESSPSPSEFPPLPQNSPSPPKIFPHPFYYLYVCSSIQCSPNATDCSSCLIMCLTTTMPHYPCLMCHCIWLGSYNVFDQHQSWSTVPNVGVPHRGKTQGSRCNSDKKRNSNSTRGGGGGGGQQQAAIPMAARWSTALEFSPFYSSTCCTLKVCSSCTLAASS